MLECAVRDLGGQIAAMDTDSAMIVSTKDGGLIPCPGGPHHLKNHQVPGGNAAVRALSFADVESIRARFDPLNPWRDTLKAPFLKLEKENFASDGERRQLYVYCISAKLYCLFNLEGNRLLVRKPSGHGLGFLQAPYTIADWQRKTQRKWTEDLPPWIFEAWHYILSRELGLAHTPPSWLKQPAVMTVPLTTPQVLERLGRFKDDLRPFTVVTVPFPRKEIGQLWTDTSSCRTQQKSMTYLSTSDGQHREWRIIPHLRQEFVLSTQAFGLAFPQDDGRRSQSDFVQIRKQVLHTEWQYVHEHNNRPTSA